MEDTFVGGETSDISIFLWFIVGIIVLFFIFLFYSKLKILKSQKTFKWYKWMDYYFINNKFIQIIFLNHILLNFN